MKYPKIPTDSHLPSTARRVLYRGSSDFPQMRFFHRCQPNRQAYALPMPTNKNPSPRAAFALYSTNNNDKAKSQAKSYIGEGGIAHSQMDKPQGNEEHQEETYNLRHMRKSEHMPGKRIHLRTENTRSTPRT